MSAPAQPPAASRAAIVGWLLFDWACQPFFTLVTTFVFAPYFAAVLAPNPVAGQSLWGYATATAGILLAGLAPVLGAVADASGPKKPWIAAAGLALVLASSALWLAAPGAPEAVAVALAAFVAGTVAVEIAAVFNNAMMTRLVAPERIGRLSGAGWAVGYLGGLASLVVVLGLLAPVPETGRTVLGLQPLLPLDAAAREGERITGPFAAAWFLAAIWPLFLFTPDAPRRGPDWRAALRTGLAQVRATVADARRHPGIGRFLLANMIYQDALVALFAFGGIYGAGVFGWGATELGIFGILLTIAGTLGALAGGRLDDRLGAGAVIRGAIVLLITVCAGVLSLGREHVLFIVAASPAAPGAGLFSTLPERFFLALGLAIGALAGPLQASSRSLLAGLAPAGETGRYFGLLALSGKVTSFLAPLAVAAATDLSGTQEAAPAVLIAFFAVGLWLMAGVRRA